MKIRMLTIAAGPGVCYAKDQELQVGKDISTALARIWVQNGFAVVTSGRLIVTPVPGPIELALPVELKE